MNSNRRHLSVSLTLLAILLLNGRAGAQPSALSSIPELNVESISASIIAEEGYKFIHFASDIEQAYDIVMTEKGLSRTILTTLPTKKLIIVVQLTPDNSLIQVRAYFTNGTATSGGLGLDLKKFTSLTYSRTIQSEHQPFLQIGSATDKVSLILKPTAKTE